MLVLIDDVAARILPGQRKRIVGLLALLLVVTVPILIAAGIAMRSGMAPEPSLGPQARGDMGLYRDIIAAVGRGESYYVAAAREHRVDGYPLRPFVTVRPPLYAYALSLLPGELWRGGSLIALAVLTLALWCRRIVARQPGLLVFGLFVALLQSGLGVAMVPSSYPLHECWAAVLIALSLVVRRPNQFVLSVLIGLAAALWRELAIPYLIAMAAMAWKDGQRREAQAFAAATVVALLALVPHALAVSRVIVASDETSPGWMEMGGWAQVLRAISYNVALSNVPGWVAAIAVPLALFGLAAARGPLGQRLALIVFGYVVLFMLVGRANTAYWGILIISLLPLGLLYVPSAIADCRKWIGGLLHDENLALPQRPLQPPSAILDAL